MKFEVTFEQMQYMNTFATDKLFGNSLYDYSIPDAACICSRMTRKPMVDSLFVVVDKTGDQGVKNAEDVLAQLMTLFKAEMKE